MNRQPTLRFPAVHIGRRWPAYHVEAASSEELEARYGDLPTAKLSGNWKLWVYPRPPHGFPHDRTVPCVGEHCALCRYGHVLL